MAKVNGSIKRILAVLLSVCVLFSAFSMLVGVAVSAETVGHVVSKIVEGENGRYIEYLGKPYLMYGMQMRIDWIYDDKDGDEEFIAENFQRVVDDGFTSVAIPIYWKHIENEDGVYDFSRLEMYYKYINQHDLTVQWLWFGTNVCGSAGEAPAYIKNNQETYKRVFAPNSPSGVYMDFSCEATLEREKLALSKMMEWLSINDTDKRCVMIQVNNEVDQGANSFDPYYSSNLSAIEKKALEGYRWYENPTSHDNYCWAGGQREEFFEYVSALGDVIHNSAYSVVTRVNFSGAGRQMPDVADDLTDLLALGGIDMVGEDIYSTQWSDITNSFTIVEDNIHHLAENGAGYDSSYNIAKTFELGGGLIIYCHRDDRTENGGGGMYVNSQGVTPDYANRSYREWVDRESSPAVRAFAETIKAVYQPLANAVANRDFVEFNGDKAETYTATETVGDINITYSADNDGLGIVFKADEKEYILNATKSASFTVDGTAPFMAEAGYYDGETWVATDETVAVDGRTVTLEAGQIVRIDFNVYYEFFGEKVSYDIPDGISIKGDTLSNGELILTSDDDTRKIITISENLQDFKISYKFKNGSGWGSSGTLAPVLLTMRGVYSFANLYYNPNGDLLFGGGDETTRHKVGGGTTGWHTAEVIMKGDQMVIVYDGIVWDSRTLVKGASSGKLAISLRYADTKLCDLKVEAATDEDINQKINADFTVEGNNNFPVTGTYNSEEKALEIPANWSEYVLDGPNDQDDVNAATVESYELEIEFRLDGVTTAAYQRGAEVHLPSGYSIGLFGSQFRTALRENLTGKGSDYFTYKDSNNLDGNYHTVKVVSKYGYEQITVDGVVLKTYEISERKSGNISWKNSRQEGTAYIKSIKLTDISTNNNRVIYSEPEVDIANRNTSNRVYTRSHGTVINEDAWVFSTSFYVKDIDAHNTGDLVWFRLKSTDSGNVNSVGLCISKTQYYMQGSGYGIKTITDANGYVPHTIGSNQVVDVRVAIIGNYIIVTIDGQTDIWYAESGIPVDSATSDHIQFFPSANDTVSIEENVVVYNTEYEYASELEGVIADIEAIGEVNADSSSLIFAADDSVDTLCDGHTDEIAYFTAKLDAAYTGYHALFADGDVTEDGNVNIIDLIRLKKIVAGSADKTIKANVDKDAEREIGAADTVEMRKLLLK